MVASTKFYRRTLTGRVRGRRTFFNRVLMQVEVKVEEIYPLPIMDGKDNVIGDPWYQWRDATIDDVIDKRTYDCRECNK